MRWSAKLGTIAGIELRMHLTFLILLFWVGLAHWQAGRDPMAALEGVVFILSLFACVVLHEFGHALTARRYGIRTRDITLLPIGGVARLERMPDDPRQELLVALAGPAVNVVIALLLAALLWATGGLAPLREMTAAGGSFLQRLMLVNGFLVVFNMLPAFPMDGGRVLRAALALRMDYVRATHIAAALGQGFAFLFGLFGLFSNPLLVFIALFVWIGAAQEASLTQMQAALAGIPLERAMLTDFRTLSSEDSLGGAAALLLAGSQQDFPVLDDGRLKGVLTRAELLAALRQRGEQGRVGDAKLREAPAAEAGEMLEVAFRRMQDPQGQTIPVLQRGRLVGLVTMENVGEFISIQSALGAGPALARRG